MSLLNKASIVTTPTSYENGKILSVKPSIVLGQELVTNGDFSNGSTGWTLGTGWSIGANKAIATGASNSNLQQVGLTISNTRKYKISFTVDNYTSGAVRPMLGAVGAVSGTYVSENGTFTETLTANNNFDRIVFRTSGSGTTLSISNISVKEAIDADFDFTRNSSATRVNSQGLIEDMQILSGDLVSNGDFSQIGSELVANGDFSNSFTNWISQGDSITIVDGAARINRITNTTFIQQNILTSGKIYLVEFDVLNKPDNNGTFTVRLGSNNVFDVVTYEGTRFSKYITSNGADFRIYSSSNSGVIYLDNVSVKEVGQDWSVTGSDANNYVEFNGSTARLKFLNPSLVTQLISSFVMTAGKKYKLTVDVATVTNGGIKVDGNGISETFDTSGITTRIINPTGATAIKFYRARSASVDITLNSVSLIEITDDTNLPRIDYTGGEGHWLFEPQSTNLLPYSSDFSGYSTGSNTTLTYESDVVAPDGSLGVYRLQLANLGSSYLSFGFLGSTSRNASIYVKSVNDGINNQFNINASGIAPNTLTATNDWQRFSRDFGSNQNYDVGINNGSDTYTTDIYIFGAQVEALSYATSYIPTNGSTVTRLADAAFGAGSSDLINSTEGVFYAEYKIGGDSTDTYQLISLRDSTGTDSDVIGIGKQAYSNHIFIRVTIGSVNVFNNLSATPIDGYNKVAISYKSGNSSAWVNGTKVYSSSSTFTPSLTLSKLSFQWKEPNQFNFYGKTKCVAVFKEALTDEELTCLTTI